MPVHKCIAAGVLCLVIRNLCSGFDGHPANSTLFNDHA
ncbi:hypothetical protein Z947_1153 [Sulfitobacter geojensis]|nr:hypothetical protein Z947_1153 [Sulfitobacter geojensis]